MNQFIPGQLTAPLQAVIAEQVKAALKEDIGSGDLSSHNLDQQSSAAEVITRDAGVLAGIFWFNEVFFQLAPTIQIDWLASDGDAIRANETLCTVTGNTAGLLAGERCALNFLQTLSATATQTAAFVAAAGKKVVVKDTRKTLPGLRVAQKYAVVCGGGTNHRQGLADEVLLKENHIRAYGSIEKAVRAVREAHPGTSIEVETENLDEVRTAIEANANTIMLDNFPSDDIDAAIQLIAGRAEIEVSGNISLERLSQVIRPGIDSISIGAITKHIRALDMSMRFQPRNPSE